MLSVTEVLYVVGWLLTTVSLGSLGMFWHLRGFPPIKFKWPALIVLQLIFLFLFHMDLALVFFPDYQCTAVLICGFIAPFFTSTGLVRFGVIYIAAITVQDSLIFEEALMANKTFIKTDLMGKSKIAWFMKYRKYFNRKTYVLVSICLSFVFLMPMFATLAAFRMDYGCKFVATIFAFIMATEMMFMGTMVTFMMPVISKAKDKIGLRSEWKSMLILPLLYTGGAILSGFPGDFMRIMAFFSMIYVPLFVVLQATVLQPLRETWKNRMLFKNAVVDNVSSTKSQNSEDHKVKKGLKRELIQCLNYPEGLDGITAFAKDEFCVENVMFYSAVVRFKSNYSNLSGGGIWQEFANVCTSFVQDEAPYALNLSARAQLSVLGKFEDQEQDVKITENVFDEALDEVLTMLAQDIFVRYRMTAGYLSLTRTTSKLSSIGDVSEVLGIAPVPSGDQVEFTH
eukprot:TRINITY_DN7654_c0_g1_i1.p1 TRINITY_DN7654_c0_g1~~TRINITY_DN7654_c0_g1_i1.p1  ORF type:complete len:454 (-),score=121.68 TRINITY_DN7654_c0_g1_i1:1281-2642(-)